ncbi:hypothetical protein RF11_05548 [Thelohanellus kitauei]|uniref:Uncharacterized protein n=1 Tax=Thelohanellus kitauei TaxID=669202 RepID=A0A0C2JNA0_THEKT|nr:hypothetical protein RF11_05548 [Thelohanellus kitauei]
MQPDSDMVKILIDNIILTIKLNASMLSVEEINEHMAKYVEILDRPSVNNEKFQELAKLTESDVIELRPVHEVIWLSRNLTVTAYVGNYNTLINYLNDGLSHRKNQIRM